MKKKMILAICIVGMFLITGLASVASAGTYRGIVWNMKTDRETKDTTATSLVGFLDNEFCVGEIIIIQGSTMLSLTGVPRFLVMFKLWEIQDWLIDHGIIGDKEYYRMIFPVIILEGLLASKVAED